MTYPQAVQNNVELEHGSAFGLGEHAIRAAGAQQAVIVSDMKEYGNSYPEAMLYAGQMLLVGQQLLNACGHSLSVCSPVIPSISHGVR